MGRLPVRLSDDFPRRRRNGPHARSPAPRHFRHSRRPGRRSGHRSRRAFRRQLRARHHPREPQTVFPDDYRYPHGRRCAARHHGPARTLGEPVSSQRSARDGAHRAHRQKRNLLFCYDPRSRRRHDSARMARAARAEDQGSTRSRAAQSPLRGAPRTLLDDCLLHRILSLHCDDHGRIHLCAREHRAVGRRARRARQWRSTHSGRLGERWHSASLRAQRQRRRCASS